MSCTNPNLMRFSVDPESGTVFSRFIGNGSYMDPKDYGTPYVDKEWYIPVPCGKCASCRMDYAREWSNRMILELQDHDQAMFLTLTYNDDHLPYSDKGFPTLVKRDVQLFLKRLRKHLNGKRIRYYFSGEYGSKTERPHYHAIIYGIGLNTFPDLIYRGSNKLGHPYFTSPTLERIWRNGFISFSSVTWRTCNYVSRYVLKKQSQIEEFNGTCCPPFNVSSRKPGIGMLRADQLLSSGFSVFSVDGKDGIHDIPIPRSIIKRLKESDHYDDLDKLKEYGDLDNIDKYYEICYNRTMIALDKLKLEASKIKVPYHDYLVSKNDELVRKLKILPERK